MTLVQDEPTKQRSRGSFGGRKSATARHCHVWTLPEMNLLVRLREDAGMAWEPIADRLGLTVEQCTSKYQNIVYRRRAADGTARTNGLPSNAAVLSLEKREQARLRQSLTGAVFGDPPPGFSALDRRRA